MACSYFEELSYEIQLIILDLIEFAVPESLPYLRLTCRYINQLAIPIVYRKFTLKSDILGTLCDPFLEKVSELAYSHVQEIAINHDLDWDLVTQFLTKCSRLQSLTWNTRRSGQGRSFPNRLRQLCEEQPNLDLKIPSYFYDADSVSTPQDILTFPADNLVSLNVSVLGGHSSMEPFQEFLSKSRRLQTLIFQYITNFQPGQHRLPPVKSLKLPIWHYSREDTKQIWDFSLLEDLEIPWSKFTRFLIAVPPEDLARLRRFRVDDSCWDWPLVEVWRERIESDSKCLPGLLSTLLKSRHDFQELDIRCPLKSFDMSLVARQGQSLRALKLLDVAGFEMEGMFPNVSLSDFSMIQQSCVCITKLDIGVDIVGSETTNFLDIISHFQKLDDLTIYTQSKLPDDMVDDVVEDLDQQTATDLKEALVSGKCGVPFVKLTVNVGGWRLNAPSQHRYGGNWSLRREKGVYPERLFIFERSHKGSLCFREYIKGNQKPWGTSPY